jgi:hypothetical protein
MHFQGECDHRGRQTACSRSHQFIIKGEEINSRHHLGVASACTKLVLVAEQLLRAWSDDRWTGNGKNSGGGDNK